MKFQLIALSLFVFSCSAQSGPITEPYMGAKKITNFPIGIAQSEYDIQFIENRGDSKEYFEKAVALEKELISLHGPSIFSAQHAVWSNFSLSGSAGSSLYGISQLDCVENVSCYLFTNSRAHEWLLTYVDGYRVDAQLVYANSGVRTAQGKFHAINKLNTTIGDGHNWQPLPLVNWPQSGIFCSVYYKEAMDDKGVIIVGKMSAVNYKRQILPDGTIENSVVEDYKACRGD